MKKILTSFFILAFLIAEPVLAAVHPNDRYYNNQWYLAKIKANQAWDIISASPDIVIAVIDGRVQLNHPDLRHNIWTNTKEISANGRDDDGNGFIDDVHGWDFVDNIPQAPAKFDPGWTETGVSHGTMVAGIIAAQGNNKIGVVGVTWSAKIMPLRVLNDRGQGKVSDVIRAIDYATNNGADIINLSFTSFKYSQALQEAIARAHQAGVIVVAAAGNGQANGQGYNISKTPIYPACYDGSFNQNMVIGVAATDALDQKAKFSSYGSRCVDITAPGISFFNTITAGSIKNNPSKIYDGYWSGTSMAAPLVSATLALIEQANPELSPRQVVNILFASTDNINRLNPHYLGELGNGRLDVFKAVEMAKAKLYSYLARLVVVSNKNIKKTFRHSKITAVNGDFIRQLSLKSLAPGSQVASGDLYGNGQNEIVVASALGQKPQIKILSSQGQVLKTFSVLNSHFRGGLNLAVSDLQGDGQTEIIVTAASAGRGKVYIYSNQGRLLRSFSVDSKNWRGGLSVAVGDLDGKENREIVVAYGRGRAPVIKIFTPTGKILSAFYAYEKTFRGGIKVAVTNVDGRRDRNKQEIIVAPGPGRNPLIKIFTNRAVLKKKFLVFRTNWQGGVNLAAGDINNNGIGDIIVGAEPGAAPEIRIFNGQGALLQSFYTWKTNWHGGANIAIIKVSN